MHHLESAGHAQSQQAPHTSCQLRGSTWSPVSTRGLRRLHMEPYDHTMSLQAGSMWSPQAPHGVWWPQAEPADSSTKWSLQAPHGARWLH